VVKSRDFRFQHIDGEATPVAKAFDAGYQNLHLWHSVRPASYEEGVITVSPYCIGACGPLHYVASIGVLEVFEQHVDHNLEEQGGQNIALLYPPVEGAPGRLAKLV
jgi:hypothetical protein